MAKKMTYVGMDVHDETIVAVWRKAGEALRAVTVSNDEVGREGLVKKIGTELVWAVYETSGNGFVLHDQVKKYGWRVSVLATTRIARSTRLKHRKTDHADAQHLLEILMAHGECGNPLPDVWVPPVKTRQQREVVRHRLHLADVAGTLRTQIKCLLKIHNVQYPGPQTGWTLTYMAWLRGLASTEGGLPHDLAVVLASRLRLLESVEREVEAMGREVERLSQQPEHAALVKKVDEIPGVGLLTAMVFLLELGDVQRFRNRKQVGSYLGLTPNSYESGEADDRKGHISRMGPPRIRKVLNQAVWAHIRVLAQEDRYYRQLKYRTGTKKAVVAMMRRLGIVMWHRALEALTGGPPTAGQDRGAA